MTIYAFIFILACMGISETLYLIGKRRSSQRPACIIGEGCEKVLSSQYNKLFRVVHNDILGCLTYSLIALLTALLFLDLGPSEWWKFLLHFLVTAASLMSMLLFYLQWRVIRSWCFWCLVSACTIWIMGITILLSPTV